MSIEARRPRTFKAHGAPHSASFTTAAIIEHAEGPIDCVLEGEGEAAMPRLMAVIEADDDPLTVPGAITADGPGAGRTSTSETQMETG